MIDPRESSNRNMYIGEDVYKEKMKFHRYIH